MAFAVLYSDGSVRTGSSREDFDGLPPEGIVRIVQDKAPQMPPGGDGYWMDDRGVINHSNSLRALYAMFNRRGVAGIVKHGETVSYEEWNASDKWAADTMRSLAGGCEGCEH